MEVQLFRNPSLIFTLVEVTMLLAKFEVILLILSFTALPCRSFVKSEEPFAQFHIEFSKIECKYIFHLKIKRNNTSWGQGQGQPHTTKKAKPAQDVVSSLFNLHLQINNHTVCPGFCTGHSG